MTALFTPSASAPRPAPAELIAAAGALPTNDYDRTRQLFIDACGAGLPLSFLKMLSAIAKDSTGLDAGTLGQLVREAMAYRPGHGVITTYEAAGKALYNHLLEHHVDRLVCVEGKLFSFDQDDGEDPATGFFSEVPLDALEEVAGEILQGLPVWRTRLDKKEVVRALMLECRDERFWEERVPGVAFRNGFLRWDAEAGEMVLEDLTEHHKAAFRVWVDYDASATAPVLEEGLARVLEDGKCWTVQEVMGAVLLGLKVGQDAVRRIVIFYGATRSGKSTLIDVLRKLLPAEVISSVPPSTWGNPNARARLAGAVLNYTPELGRTLRLGEEAKKISACEAVTARLLYKDEAVITSNAWHLCGSNELPRIDDLTGAMDRRLLVIHFAHSIREEEVDGDFLKKVEAELPGVVAWMVEGARRLMRRGRFELPPGHASAITRMKHGDDLLALFVHEMIEAAPGARLRSVDIRAAMAQFAEANGGSAADVLGSGAMKRFSSLAGDMYDAVRSASNNVPHWTGIRLKAEAPVEEAADEFAGL